jgi:hypothetical protein
MGFFHSGVKQTICPTLSPPPHEQGTFYLARKTNILSFLSLKSLVLEIFFDLPMKGVVGGPQIRCLAA